MDASLSAVLTWVLSGGSGVLSYFLMEKVKQLAALNPEPKRYVALGISAAVAVLAYLAQMGMGYATVPVDTKAWIESIFAVVGVACGVGQVLHARVKLSGRFRKAE